MIDRLNYELNIALNEANFKHTVLMIELQIKCKT